MQPNTFPGENPVHFSDAESLPVTIYFPRTIDFDFVNRFQPACINLSGSEYLSDRDAVRLAFLKTVPVVYARDQRGVGDLLPHRVREAILRLFGHSIQQTTHATSADVFVAQMALHIHNSL
jgi:hypothetical protein